ncbi:MAG: hypothetical protein WC342_00835 [Methanoregula sp.]
MIGRAGTRLNTRFHHKSRAAGDIPAGSFRSAVKVMVIFFLDRVAVFRKVNYPVRILIRIGFFDALLKTGNAH